MTTPLDKITCPTCQKAGTWKPDNAFRPFCSERCKLIDLGEWAAEKHAIPGDDEDAINQEDSEDNAQ